MTPSGPDIDVIKEERIVPAAPVMTNQERVCDIIKCLYANTNASYVSNSERALNICIFENPLQCILFEHLFLALFLLKPLF